jgi:aryl-alcohol dehydrogenase-like predicted oxidoreductase
MRLTRREMLKLTAGAGAALTLGRLDALGQEPSMRRRPIPSTGEEIPVVGLGTSRTFDVGDSAGEREPLREVVRRFVELGGRLLDTAPGYGNSERVSGELAADLGVSDRLFFATKVGAESREAGIEQMETSLRLLRRQSLDLIQVHNLRGWQTQLGTLREWKAAGRVRYLGITTSSDRQYEDFARVMEGETLDFVQIDYSLGNRGAEERLLPLAAERGMAVIINLPFQRARLFQAVQGRELPAWAAEFDCASWGQFFLKFVLSHPAVTCAIPATSNPDHLRDNMGAGYGRLPDAAQRRRMVEFFESL